MTIKKVFLERWYPDEKLLGQFLTSKHYDLLVQEDCDVYKPSKDLLSAADSEENLLLSFRKNVFSEGLVKHTWENIRFAAQQSQNRGLSSGPRESGIREWVTDEQLRLIDQLMKATKPSLTETPIVWDVENDKVTKGLIWLKDKVKEQKFDFACWLLTMMRATNEERVEQANWVFDTLISKTQYANPSMSGVAGYFDRNPRFPYCREATFNKEFSDEFRFSTPFIEEVGKQFKKLTPERFQRQMDAIDKVPEYRVGKSPYTTITVNKNYRTASHRDAGDLTAGFGNLTVVSDPALPKWKGAYLVFPEYRCAVDVQPGDMLAMDVHEIHGNTPISGLEGFERISIVCYFREGLLNCEDQVAEMMRHEFVESRRQNKNHPSWKPGWNGVTEGMWESNEWSKYETRNQA